MEEKYRTDWVEKGMHAKVDLVF